MRLHLFDRAGDELDDADGLSAFVYFGQQLREGVDRTLLLEIDDDRLLMDQFGATLRTERCEGFVMAEDMG